MGWIIVGISVVLIALVCGMARAAGRADDHAERTYLDWQTYKTKRIIDTVRRQQWRVLSRNRHLIVGQQVRRRGELVWPWDRDEGQGDA